MNSLRPIDTRRWHVVTLVYFSAGLAAALLQSCGIGGAPLVAGPPCFCLLSLTVSDFFSVSSWFLSNQIEEGRDQWWVTAAQSIATSSSFMAGSIYCSLFLCFGFKKKKKKKKVSHIQLCHVDFLPEIPHSCKAFFITSFAFTFRLLLFNMCKLRRLSYQFLLLYYWWGVSVAVTFSTPLTQTNPSHLMTLFSVSKRGSTHSLTDLRKE